MRRANPRPSVRNSRHPGGPVLIFTRAEMAAFIQGAKEGEFDEMTGSSSAWEGERHVQSAVISSMTLFPYCSLT